MDIKWSRNDNCLYLFNQPNSPTRPGILFSVRIQFQILMESLHRTPARWKYILTLLSVKSILLSLKIWVYSFCWFQGRFDFWEIMAAAQHEMFCVVLRSEITQKSMGKPSMLFTRFLPLVILMTQDKISKQKLTIDGGGNEFDLW